MKPELIEELKKLAGEEVWSDDPDFAIDDYAGGNIDDAFYGGERCGRTKLAREILEKLGIVS